VNTTSEQDSVVSTTTPWVRAIGGMVLGMVLGFIGLSMLFSDLGPAESPLGRTLTTAVLLFGGGVIVGLVAGRRWWYLSGICSWGGVLIGIVTARLGIDRILLFLALPLGLALAGGYASVLLLQSLSRRKHS